MTNTSSELAGKVVLITGAARRVGAAIARAVHAKGMNVALHYRSSRDEAQRLQEQFNCIREHSAVLIQSDLLHTGKLAPVIKDTINVWGRLDALVNNASSFYPTPMGTITEAQWDDLVGTNLKAPLFLSQAAAPALTINKGCIVNITDIHAERPLKNFGVYSAAKAGLVMLTKVLARELAPAVRVNAIAPGAVLWPEDGRDEVTKQRIISRTALKHPGTPDDVARAVLFLLHDAGYMTGQVVTIDGGRSLHS